MESLGNGICYLIFIGSLTVRFDLSDFKLLVIGHVKSDSFGVTIGNGISPWGRTFSDFWGKIVVLCAKVAFCRQFGASLNIVREGLCRRKFKFVISSTIDIQSNLSKTPKFSQSKPYNW